MGVRERSVCVWEMRGTRSGTKGWGSHLFYAFPWEHNCERFMGHLLEEGKVVDVFIPQRRSKSVQQFGFVCFMEVENEGKLEHVLNNICIWDKRLYVNWPRFGTNGVWRSVNQAYYAGHKKVEHNKTNFEPAFRREGCYYAQATKAPNQV